MLTRTHARCPRPHLNCASQRRVGKVWCTPRYLEVKVLPPDFCLLALVILPTWRTPPPAWRSAGIAAGAGIAGTSGTEPEAGTMAGTGTGRAAAAAAAAVTAAAAESGSAGTACDVGTKVEGCRPAAG